MELAAGIGRGDSRECRECSIEYYSCNRPKHSVGHIFRTAQGWFHKSNKYSIFRSCGEVDAWWSLTILRIIVCLCEWINLTSALEKSGELINYKPEKHFMLHFFAVFWRIWTKLVKMASDPGDMDDFWLNALVLWSNKWSGEVFVSDDWCLLETQSPKKKLRCYIQLTDQPDHSLIQWSHCWWSNWPWNYAPPQITIDHITLSISR